MASASTRPSDLLIVTMIQRVMHILSLDRHVGKPRLRGDEAFGDLHMAWKLIKRLLLSQREALPSDARMPAQLSLKHRRGGMCSPPDSIPILQMLVRLTNAQRVVEVGVFTGCVQPTAAISAVRK